MPHVRDKAICLRRLDYSETSQILHLFARTLGPVRVIAKGAKRHTRAGHSRFDGGLDLLDLGDAVLLHAPEKDLSTLTDWTLLDGHLALRASLRPLYLAQYAAELVAALFHDHDPHPEVFDDLEAALTIMSRGRAEEAFLAFQLRALHAAGLWPDWDHCTACGQEIEPDAPIAFHPARSGVIHPTCARIAADILPLDPRLITLVRAFAAKSLPQTPAHPRPPFRAIALPTLTPAQTTPLNQALAAHISHATSRPLRLPRYILGP